MNLINIHFPYTLQSLTSIKSIEIFFSFMITEHRDLYIVISFMRKNKKTVINFFYFSKVGASCLQMTLFVTFFMKVYIME